METELIDEKMLLELCAEAEKSERQRMNRDMRNSSEDSSQRMLNALQPDTKLPIHRHQTTSEVQILLRGKIDVIFYDDNGAEIRKFHLDPKLGKYGVNIPKGMWHNLVVLEKNSVIFEAKDGAYKPLQTDDIQE